VTVKDHVSKLGRPSSNNMEVTLSNYLSVAMQRFKAAMNCCYSDPSSRHQWSLLLLLLLVTMTIDASNKVAATSCFDCLRYLTLCYGRYTKHYEPNVA